MIKLIMTVVLLVGSLVGGFYVVHPHYVRHQMKLAENEVLYEELENVVNYINELKRIATNINENRESLAKLRTALPEDHDAPSFFLYLKEKVEENNLTLSSNVGAFSVKNHQHNETDHPRIKDVEFSLSFEGDYRNVKNFFKEIETLIRLIRVENINIAGGLSEDPFQETRVSGRNVSIDISGKTYSY